MNRIFKITIAILLSALLFSCILSFNNKEIKLKNDSESKKTEYVFGTEDVPLFPGLAQVKDDATNFDTMTGNIVISTYSGNVDVKSVKNFYLETMPQLGWILTSSNHGKLSYKRKGDSLEILLRKEKGSLTVKFFISSI
jgi:PBP1b-binding outer membrane lipoprotein LpoB